MIRFWFLRGLARAAAASLAILISLPVNAEDVQVADAELKIAANPVQAIATPDDERTRFVIGLNCDCEFDVLTLSNPNRVVIELPDVKLHLPDARDGAKGLVKSFRGGLAAPGKTRVVIDVTQPVVVETAITEKAKDGTYRLALDILPADAGLRKGARKNFKTPPSGLGAAGVQPPLPKPAESPRQRAARAFKPVIVLDPGHGGMDSGATKNGTVEKNVVLAFSHALREQLEATGRYKVMMTRDKDVFIDLDERRAYAERNSANLFIAIHADYAGTRARGATIFSLRDNVASSLRNSTHDRLSPNEMKVVKSGGDDPSAVTNILADLAERDVQLTKDRTDLFAKTVIANMSESTTMRDEPDQQAAFRVLKTAQFPSVLIELAYVSNLQDARNLKSDEWREKVAESIVSAIDNYFSNQVALMPM